MPQEVGQYGRPRDCRAVCEAGVLALQAGSSGTPTASASAVVKVRNTVAEHTVACELDSSAGDACARSAETESFLDYPVAT